MAVIVIAERNVIGEPLQQKWEVFEYPEAAGAYWSQLERAGWKVSTYAGCERIRTNRE